MTRDRIVNVLKNLKFTTTHYQVPVEVISDAQFEAAAEQILLLIQLPEEDSQPQLKQAPCKTLLPLRKCHDCGTEYYSDGRCPECFS